MKSLKIKKSSQNGFERKFNYFNDCTTFRPTSALNGNQLGKDNKSLYILIS